MTYDKVYQDSDRDYWMRADKAKAYGMIDEILVTNLGNEDKLNSTHRKENSCKLQNLKIVPLT